MEITYQSACLVVVKIHEISACPFSRAHLSVHDAPARTVLRCVDEHLG